ncbi:ankyrin repeat domain-containing protein [Legionella sp. WA2022007384]
MNDETFKIPNGQEWLIGRMQSLGYKGNPGGMCFGLCEMARQAVQLGSKEYSLFQERLKQIALIPIENFPEEIERIKAQRLALFQKAKQQAKEELEEKNEGVALDKHINDLANEKFISLMADLPLEDRARLSIDMFLDGVELYFHPSVYPMLFHSQMKHQISDAAAILVEPNQLQQKKLRGELPSPLVFTGSYGTEDLYSYLAILQKQLKDCKNPIPLRLNSENHALCLVFDPSEDEENCWTLFDPNKMANMDEPGGEESGDYIERGFCGEGEQKPTIEFSTWIHFPSNEDKLMFQANATAENAEWNNMHNPTDFNRNLLNIAIYNGDIEAIKNFLDIGFNILEKNNRGLDYLDLAIVYDHPDIVQLFLEKIPKTQLHSGYLIKAIDCGNLKMTKMLLEAGLDPMAIDKSLNKSPLDFSAQKSHLPDNKNTIHQEIYEAVKTKAESFHKKENKSFKNKLISIKEAESDPEVSDNLRRKY